MTWHPYPPALVRGPEVRRTERGYVRYASPEERLRVRSVETDQGCWEFLGYRAAKGYGQIKVDKRMVAAHRHAWEVFVGPIPAGLHVLHHCDNPPCVNPDHLFLGTNLDNVQDRVDKGRSGGPKGEDVSTAKLTVEKVREIRRLHAQGFTNTHIAPLVGVNDRSVSNVVLGKTWRSVT